MVNDFRSDKTETDSIGDLVVNLSTIKLFTERTLFFSMKNAKSAIAASIAAEPNTSPFTIAY